MALVGAAALVAAALLRLRQTWVVITVSGPSMQPSYHNGDRVAVRRSPPHEIATGDVVVVEWPGHGPARSRAARHLDEGRWLIKRVGATAGEPVPAGIPVDDDVVPPGKLVLLGDNPDASYDSRMAGYFPTAALLGGVARTMRRT